MIKRHLKFFILFFLFLFSFSIRIWRLNEMGRAWDEPEYVEQGYKMIELLKNGDFSNPYFYTTYDHPPLVKYLYGITAHFDSFSHNGKVEFNYDFTYSRLLSGIISSLSVVVIALIGMEFISFFAGLTSGIIIAMIPFFLGLSQLVTTESFIMLFFSLAVYLYLLLIQKYSLKKLILAGLVTGISLQVKQSNILLLPLFVLFNISWIYFNKKFHISFIKQVLRRLFFLCVIAILVFVVIWPMPFLNLGKVYELHNHFWNVTTSPPEIFFGRLMLTPIFYYPVMFGITTPVIILVLFFSGLLKINTSKKWAFYVFVIWFYFPFIQSFYSWRQHGIRYIIEIYAPMALICGIGLEYLTSKISHGEKAKYVSLFLVFLYLSVILTIFSPYYLDYFNEAVGGTKRIYQKKLFQIGWWGQGVREAGQYILNNAKPGSSIGLAISPIHSVPPLSGYKTYEYEDKTTYDYVMVNDFHVLREGFDDSNIRKKYRLIYEVKVNGASLVYVYKR